MHITAAAIALLGAIGLLVAYLFIKGPPKISDATRNSELLFWLTMSLMVSTIGMLISLIAFILWLMLHLV